MKKFNVILEKVKFAVEKIKLKVKFKIPKPADIRERLKDKRFKRNLFIGVLVGIVVMLVLARTFGNIQKTLFKKKEAKKPAITFEEGLSPVKILKVKRMDFKDTLPVM